jgi:predicted SprT family Zn-dependent metalloprotease
MTHKARVAAPITTVEYTAFQAAYDFYNARLFAGTLPAVYVTLQRKGKSRGYFHADRFSRRGGGKTTAHELALNPDTFGRTDEQILSTLVHEMCHVWQQEHGTPSRTGYHNREWAIQMFAIGLNPSDTGKPGGKKTGQRVSHYIVSEGPFQVATRALLADGFTLNWKSEDLRGLRKAARKQRTAKAASKTKYTCPDCGLNVWAKPDALVVCGSCYEDTQEAIHLVPELETLK